MNVKALILCGALTIASLLWGCVRKESERTLGAKREIRNSLRQTDFRMIYASPGNLTKESKPSEVIRVVEEREIVFDRAFPLLKKKEDEEQKLFLVWDAEKDPADAIIDSSYSVVGQNSGEVVTFQTEPRTALYNETDKSWYIPLTDLLKGRIASDEAGVRYRTMVDLNYASGGRQIHYITFSLYNPSKEVSHEVLKIYPPDLSGKAVKSPVVLERYVNSSEFKMRLWFTSNADFSLITNFNRKYFKQNAERSPSELNESYRAIGQATLGFVRQLGTEEVLGIGRSPVFMDLDPGASLEVEWLVGAAEGAKTCEFPENQKMTLRWKEMTKIPPFKPQARKRSGEYVDESRVQSVEMRGVLSWETRLGFTDQSFEEAKILASESRPVDQQKGTQLIGTPQAWDCEGLFE